MIQATTWHENRVFTVTSSYKNRATWSVYAHVAIPKSLEKTTINSFINFKRHLSRNKQYKHFCCCCGLCMNTYSGDFCCVTKIAKYQTDVKPWTIKAWKNHDIAVKSNEKQTIANLYHTFVDVRNLSGISCVNQPSMVIVSDGAKLTDVLSSSSNKTF